jgi:predicted GNAT family acetyltransferase
MVKKVAISHDASKREFRASVGAADAGYLTYVRLEDGSLSVDHTVVWQEFEGNGIGRRLVESAMAFAEHEGVRVSATCSYAAHVIGGSRRAVTSDI